MNIFNNIEFISKGYFLMLILLPLIIYFFYKKESSGFDFIFQDIIKEIFKENSYNFYIKIVLLCLILINYILLLSNPHITNVSENIKKNGIDIVIVLDISGSMEAEDLKPNRIEAAKKVINGFIGKLKTDRLGLVVFAGKPFTSIPLTFDYNILTETISRLGVDNINQNQRGLNGTAIGDSILMAKTLFNKDEVEKREKVIILLSDGDANVGVEPTLAGLSAAKQGIKIYTIGIGSKQGGVITYNSGPFMRQARMPPLNDKTLKQIAKDTSGEYFRADNNEVFKEIFQKLEILEKNDIEIEIKKEYKNYYTYFLYSLIVLLGLFTYIMITSIEVKQNKN